jgi:hypothetical protein
MVIVLYKGYPRWRWQLIGYTGRIVLSSRNYLFKWLARWTARKLAKKHKYDYREVDDVG